MAVRCNYPTSPRRIGGRSSSCSPTSPSTIMAVRCNYPTSPRRMGGSSSSCSPTSPSTIMAVRCNYPTSPWRMGGSSSSCSPTSPSTIMAVRSCIRPRKKSVAVFRSLGQRVLCIQSKCNYFVTDCGYLLETSHRISAKTLYPVISKNW